MTSKLSARQRELLTRMANGWEMQSKYSLLTHRVIHSLDKDGEWHFPNGGTVSSLVHKGFIAPRAAAVYHTFYALTDAGRAVVREQVNGEQGDEG